MAVHRPETQAVVFTFCWVAGIDRAEDCACGPEIWGLLPKPMATPGPAGQQSVAPESALSSSSGGIRAVSPSVATSRCEMDGAGNIRCQRIAFCAASQSGGAIVHLGHPSGYPLTWCSQKESGPAAISR